MNFIELKPGLSTEGDEIKAFKTEGKDKKYIYLMAGVHGDEVEGVYGLKEFFEWLKTSEVEDTPMVVIPILNVDGYRQGTRTNAHGVDLNRNLATSNWEAEVRAPKYNPGSSAMSEKENIYLDKLFQKHPPAMILTFHSWKPMYNYNGDCKEIAEFLSNVNGYEPTCDVGYPTPGSLGNYAPEKYDCPVLTIEFPTIESGKELKEIWQENEKGFKELFRSNLLKEKLK